MGLLESSIVEGSVRFDSRLNRLHGIGYIPQQLDLFAASVSFNVCYPELIPDHDRVVSALKKADIYDLVAGYPSGLETKLGLGGQEVSGGQRQRLLLARVFYHQFSLILLDEGTSAIDSKSEGFVQQELRKLLKQGHTVVSVAHRITTPQSTDCFLALKGGRLKEVKGG